MRPWGGMLIAAAGRQDAEGAKKLDRMDRMNSMLSVILGADVWGELNWSYCYTFDLGQILSSGTVHRRAGIFFLNRANSQEKRAIMRTAWDSSSA